MLLKVFLFGSYAIEMENDVNLDHQYLSKYRHVILKLFVKTEGTGFPNKDRTKLVYNIFVWLKKGFIKIRNQASVPFIEWTSSKER